ncbi:DUF86 domain-containing protein [Synechocystis salina LEGE 06155]|nr:DUF86 domain-containing protein [Synechocystis salina LEGE 06155]
MNRDLASILDALIFARRIILFTKDMPEEEFFSDIKTQDAVMRNIAVLGEALRRISPEFRDTYPEIPYSQIIGMRNKLVHDYDGINLELIWDVIENYIPNLIGQLEKIVPKPDD